MQRILQTPKVRKYETIGMAGWLAGWLVLAEADPAGVGANFDIEVRRH